MLAGLALALIGLLLDSILPGGQPGIGVPQLLIVAAGLALAAFGWRLRVGGRSIAGQLKENWRQAVAITVITLACVELALTVAGLSTYYPVELPEVDMQAVDWWQCAEVNCVHSLESARRACDSGDLTGRHCLYNAMGYGDRDEFVASPELVQRQRVLFLGDSFTRGFSADVGFSFVERVESALPGLAGWNAGINATGTGQALVAFRSLAPIMQPQLTILGFYAGNDFQDNQRRRYSGFTSIAGDGLQYVPITLVDRLGRSWQPDRQTFLRYHQLHKTPPASEVERVAGLTRLGTVVLRGLDFLSQALGLDQAGLQVDITRGLLRQLRDEARETGSEFLTLVLQSRGDLPRLAEAYETALALMRELGLPYLELGNELIGEDDYAENDIHWNNAGHGKVGAILAECIEAFFAEGSLSACESVVLP